MSSFIYTSLATAGLESGVSGVVKLPEVGILAGSSHTIPFALILFTALLLLYVFKPFDQPLLSSAVKETLLAPQTS